jgi:hypothetical protein
MLRSAWKSIPGIVLVLEAIPTRPSGTRPGSESDCDYEHDCEHDYRKPWGRGDNPDNSPGAICGGCALQKRLRLWSLGM